GPGGPGAPGAPDVPGASHEPHAPRPASANPPRTDPTERPGPPIPGSGQGLIGLAERAALAGGRLDHGHTADGFRL
ncbi:hypothetical protein KDA82_39890, partial [Streptomyces daliensis]|nr:hypothetical protein [Streptomyces daliensis]